MSSELFLNHFEVFGLPARFALDVEELGRRYRELQRGVHPDRYVNASDQERRLSLQRSAQINEAYRTLREPLGRARYLLALHGILLDDDHDTAMEPAFLMEQMELREALEEVRTRPDPHGAAAGVLASVEQRAAEITTAVHRQLDAGGDALVEARQGVRKLQFLDRLREEALEVQSELEDELG